MPQVYVTVGMIASGKTTFSRKLAESGALVISHDDLTEMLHGSYCYDPALREAYRGMMRDIARHALTAGRSVVIDRTHLTREARAEWVALALADWVPRLTEVVMVIAVEFRRAPAAEHARRRFEADPRGRTLGEWERVARHHEAQAVAEPLDPWAEGFDAVIAPDGSFTLAP